MLLWLALPASAATLTVGASGRDYTSVQAAIDAAAAGDTVAVDAGTYPEALTITKAITISGAGTSTVLSGDGASATVVTIVDVGTTAAVTLSDLAITPTTGRGIYAQNSLLALSTVDVTGADVADDHGGGLEAISCQVTIADATFSDDSAIGLDGGGIYFSGTTATLTRVTFDGDRAEKGGGLYANGGSVECSQCTFTNDSVRIADEAGRGGAIRTQYTDLTIEDSTFDANSVDNGYGGHVATNGGTLTIHASAFSNGTATEYYGGALALYDTATTITGSTFTSNTASRLDDAGYGHGGAIMFYGDPSAATADLVVDTTTFADNFAELYGGAIRDEIGDLTITDSTFAANQSYYGGAMHVATAGAASMSGVTFDSNEATYGGAIRWRPDDYAGSLALTNCTFTANSATSYGGAMYGRTAGQFTMIDSRLTGNTAVVGGGMLLWDLQRVDAERNLLCTNTATGDSSQSDGGAMAEYQVGAGGQNRWANNLFVENTALAYGGGLSVLDSFSTVVLNNSFLTNEADVLGGSLAVRNSSAAVDNDLFAYTNGGDALTGDATAVVSETYADWWQNVPADVGDAMDPATMSSSDVEVDPMLVAYSPDGDCTNDTYWLQPGSPLVDAGDPSQLDPDGSRSDIGAFGGPGADPEVFTDADADGYVVVYDCDDASADVHPGATEVPYDGVDQDCDGADLTDVDGDSFAGGSTGDDCDDADATVHPGATELWYDGVDQDCDGADDFDQDGDGYDLGESAGDDCDDTDAAVNPAADDAAGDGDDQNCDGVDGVVEIADDTGGGGKGCGCDHADGAVPWAALLAAMAFLRGRRQPGR